MKLKTKFEYRLINETSERKQISRSRVAFLLKLARHHGSTIHRVMYSTGEVGYLLGEFQITPKRANR